MMIQGHTIQSLLDVSYKNSDSYIYHLWLFLRAFTAPLFIFVAGFIFTYLLYQTQSDNKKTKVLIPNNRRMEWGIKRGVSLILVGYLLRYPTIKLFSLTSVSLAQWNTFFTVDALHLIGTGLLLIVLFAKISYKGNVNPLIVFLSLALAIFIITPFVLSLEWNDSGNIFLLSYISFQFGSIFPLFPYLIFLFFGATLGTTLAMQNDILNRFTSIVIITFVGVFLIVTVNTSFEVYAQSLLQTGVILILLSLSIFITHKINNLPKIIKSFARNSLWLYVIHLVIIYGSPISIGLHQIIGKTLSVYLAIFTAIAMLILMTIISLGIDKFRLRKFDSFERN